MYGGGSYNRPMKRSHSPDGYETSHFQDNHRFRGGHHQFSNKRYKTDGNYNHPLTIDDKLTRLGDLGSKNSEIGQLAKDIQNELCMGDEGKITALTSQICKCIVSFPTRVATYATLIGLISVKHYNVSCQIINTLHASYPVYLEAQKWQEALTIIHLLSCLVNCKVIRPSALLSQFELLLDITLEDNIPQTRSDYYVYTVLSSLPLVALELATQTSEQNTFDHILQTIEDYLKKRSKEHLNVTRVWLSADSTIQMDYLESLWVQTKNFRANNWVETFLHRPYNEKEYSEILASGLTPQNSPTIQIPAHSAHYVYPAPRIVFRIFEDDVAEGFKSIPGSDKIERFCIENHIRNIIDETSSERSFNCARHLFHMPRTEHLPMKHLLIETILGEHFTLPYSKHHSLLYQSLLHDFTKIFHYSKKQELKFNYDIILNEAVKVLYENLDTMNVTCFNRFIDWFSFHLNNTEFLFPWQNWLDSTLKEKDSPKAVFVREMLDRCVRLSFHKKMSALVSNTLANLMPPEVGVKYQPVYADNPKAEDLATTIKKLIVEKADAKTISETLNVQIDGVEVKVTSVQSDGTEMAEDYIFREEKHFDKLLKVDIFTAVILHIASKSLTHLSSAIGKFRNVFRALARVESGQVQLLQTMHSCLETHPQLQVILVDKLLKAELVEAREVCNWIFSDSMKQHHLNSYPWELLNSTISRTSGVIEKLVDERNRLVEENVTKSKEENTEKDGDGDIEMKQEDGKQLLDEKIEVAKSVYYKLTLQVFQMFSDMLGDHIRKCEVSSKSYMDNWFRSITGRMQQVYYLHYDDMRSHYDELKVIIDRTPSIGNAIVNLNQ